MIDQVGKPGFEAGYLVREAIVAAQLAREQLGDTAKPRIVVTAEPRVADDEDAVFVTVDAVDRESGALTSRIVIKVDAFTLSSTDAIRERETVRVGESLVRWLRRIN